MKNKSEEYWKEKLTPEQYKILRERGTEIPFTGKLLNKKGDGTYNCAACGQELFSSDSKFGSGSGWPAFSEVIDTGKVDLKMDHRYGMDRVEVSCSNCGSHLGHVFEYKVTDTGKWYCINSTCLQFKEKQ